MLQIVSDPRLIIKLAPVRTRATHSVYIDDYLKWPITCIKDSYSDTISPLHIHVPCNLPFGVAQHGVNAVQGLKTLLGRRIVRVFIWVQLHRQPQVSFANFRL